MLIYILFAIGFVFVIGGAEYLVNGASSLAKKMNVSNLAIGLTIVAIGTSLPEFIVNIFASIQHNSSIVISNILGSNTVNIFFILGLGALIYPFRMARDVVWREIPISLAAAALVGFLANDLVLGFGGSLMLARIDGLVMLLFFIIFMRHIFKIAKDGRLHKYRIMETKEHSWAKSIWFVVLGVATLIVGGKWVVDGAISLAAAIGVSASFIGFTIVAFGTSLPELATTIVAAYKKNTDMAVGGIVGSNIFNIFFILGLSAVINPVPFNARSNQDIFITALASAFLFIFMFIGKKNALERWQGALFVFFYAIYIAFLIIQQYNIPLDFFEKI